MQKISTFFEACNIERKSLRKTRRIIWIRLEDEYLAGEGNSAVGESGMSREM